ncbi:MAG: P63C domain-containing protein [Chthoniobacterales bacterium]
MMLTKKSETATVQSLGGKARAAILSPEERKAIASRAATARWDIQTATHEGTIQIGENISMRCAVLEDGTRVLTQQGMHVALGRHKNIQGEFVNVDKPKFLAAANLSPFISKDLEETWTPIKFRPSTKSGGNANAVSIGYRAEILPLVCHVYEDAERAGVLHVSQKHIAEKARVLSRSFSKLGIVALVDEATGYQYDRAQDALAKILEKFIAKELQPWTRTFPLEFYQHICRLNGWGFNPETMQGPRRLAQCTTEIVYQRLAPGVLDELRRKNPVIDGRRKHKLFQWFTGEIGHPKLLAHLEGTKILLRESSTWEEFKERLNRHYPIMVTTELGLEVQEVK